MKKYMKRGLILSLLALAIPAYALAGVQGSYFRENNAETSYAILQLKSLSTSGREPIVYGEIKGAIGSGNSVSMSYSFYTPFYQDNEKEGVYHGIIHEVGEIVLKVSPDKQNVRIEVKGDIPKHFAANYKYGMKDVEFSDSAAVDLIQNAPSAVTGLKGEYEIDVEDAGEFWIIKATNGNRNIARFSVDKSFSIIDRTDIEPNVPVYTPEETNASIPVG